MNHVDIFRILEGLERDPRSTEEIWKGIAEQEGFIDSRDCGLFDAVQSGWYVGDKNELFKGFPISPEDDVLDFGCGAGGATLFCAARGASVTYIDMSEQTIRKLQEKILATPARRNRGIVSDSTSIPLEDECMSRIIAMEVAEHVEDPLNLLRELTRIGKPGALYLLTVPDPIGENIQRNFAPDYYFKKPNHIHVFERSQFSELVSDAGLEILHKDGTGFFWTFWMLIYWTLAKSTGVELEGESLEVAKPPYPKLLNDWAKLWYNIISLPEAKALKSSLDQLLPKSQIIVAKKPSRPG